MAAQKDYKKISSTGDEFTHHGFAAKRTLVAPCLSNGDEGAGVHEKCMEKRWKKLLHC